MTRAPLVLASVTVSSGVEHRHLADFERRAVDLQIAVDADRRRVPRARVRARRRRPRRIARRHTACRRTCATGAVAPNARAGDHAQRDAVAFDRGSVVGRDGARTTARSLRRRAAARPTSECRASSGRCALLVGRALRMDDAAPGRHPVDVAGDDFLHRAEAVAMHDRAFEQIGDRGEADVRMRPHVEADAGLKRGRAHVVEEDERADQARRHGRQHAPHGQTADVAQMRFEDCFDRGGHGQARLECGWGFWLNRRFYCGGRNDDGSATRRRSGNLRDSVARAITACCRLR